MPYEGQGVSGFFIKDSVLSLFDVYELDKSYEGIFWIKLAAKQDESLQYMYALVI